MNYSENLVWMDLEMSGLDPEKERILEVATIVTDSSLNILEEGPVIYVHQDSSVIDAMDEWNTKHHHESGLVDLVREQGIAEADAEQQTLDFIKRFVEAGTAPLCGNSIGQDRRFLVKYMPTLEGFLHYRNIDVSTVKELCVRWRPDLYREINKQGRHRALDDIRESIEELRYYREHFLNVEAQA